MVYVCLYVDIYTPHTRGDEKTISWSFFSLLLLHGCWEPSSAYWACVTSAFTCIAIASAPLYYT